MMRKRRICLDAIEDVQSSVEVFPDIILVFAKVEVECAEYDAYGDISMERRNKEPCAEVVTGDISCDALPYFRRSTMGCWFVHEMNLPED